jgi:hypothetical protein
MSEHNFWAGFDGGNDEGEPAGAGLQWALDILEKHERTAATAIQRAYRKQ